jgi:hypothetical protein
LLRWDAVVLAEEQRIPLAQMLATAAPRRSPWLAAPGLRAEVRHERGKELYVGRLLEAVLCGR